MCHQHATQCTYLVHGSSPPNGWVGTTSEKDFFGTFPVPFCVRLALLKIHSDMVPVPSHTKDVVFVVFGAVTVLLLNACFLPTTHVRGLYTPINLCTIVIKDEGHPFTIGWPSTLLPGQANLTGFAARQTCIWFVRARISQVAHLGGIKPKCHTVLVT
jgi:hypothetical protein